MRFTNKHRKGIEIYHHSKGNNYGTSSAISCVPKRLPLPKKHDVTFKIEKVNCPICIDALIEKRVVEIAFLKQSRKDNQDLLSVCQAGFKIEVNVWKDFKPDPEVLARIRAGI